MFTYFIPLTVNLTKNSKLEKFVHELNALWKLSGSSMGALRELVAVAGMVCPYGTKGTFGKIRATAAFQKPRKCQQTTSPAFPAKKALVTSFT